MVVDCRECVGCIGSDVGAWWPYGRGRSVHAGWRRRGSACTEWRGWPVARRCRPPRDSAPRVRRTSSAQPPARQPAPPPPPPPLHAAVHHLHHALAQLSHDCGHAAECRHPPHTYTYIPPNIPHEQPTPNITCQFMLLGCRKMGTYRLSGQ